MVPGSTAGSRGLTDDRAGRARLRKCRVDEQFLRVILSSLDWNGKGLARRSRRASDPPRRASDPPVRAAGGRRLSKDKQNHTGGVALFDTTINLYRTVDFASKFYVACAVAVQRFEDTNNFSGNSHCFEDPPNKITGYRGEGRSLVKGYDA